MIRRGRLQPGRVPRAATPFPSHPLPRRRACQRKEQTAPVLTAEVRYMHWCRCAGRTVVSLSYSTHAVLKNEECMEPCPLTNLWREGEPCADDVRMHAPALLLTEGGKAGRSLRQNTRTNDGPSRKIVGMQGLFGAGRPGTRGAARGWGPPPHNQPPGAGACRGVRNAMGRAGSQDPGPLRAWPWAPPRHPGWAAASWPFPCSPRSSACP